MDPKAKYLATGGSDALISIWDTTDWICVRTLDRAEHPIRSVSFSFDGAFIAAGSDEAMPIDIVRLSSSVEFVLSNLSTRYICRSFYSKLLFNVSLWLC